MDGALKRRSQWISMAVLLVAAAMLVVAGQARGATYPSGGGTFTGSAEGWKNPQPPACNIGLGLCSATAGYDGAAGKPAGSLATTTTVLLNVGGLFKSTAAFESPDFTATEGGAATLHVDRQLASGNVLDLTPALTYTATLIDRTTGVSTDVVNETVSGSDEAFAGKDGATKLVNGHTYAILLSAEVSSSLASVGLLGSATARFDNVSVVVGSEGEGGGGGGGGGGSSSLTDKQLTTLMQNSLVGPAVIKGKRIFVKAKCPAKVGTACKVTVQGLLKKGKSATGKRTAKIAKGKTKQLVLKVKPKLKAKVATKKRMLFKQSVKAGKAKATVYKNLKLIKRR